MNSFVHFVFFFVTIKGCSSLENTPVFVFDDGVLQNNLRLKANPFELVPAEHFLDIAKELQGLSETLIFFVEEYLCVEDITARDIKGTPYAQVYKNFLAKKMIYLPQVEDAYIALRSQFQAFDFNTFHLRSTTTKLRLEKVYKFMYIFFEDGANETRIDSLRRHDMMIMTVLFAVRQLSTGPVTAIYTGKRNPVVIKPVEEVTETDVKHDTEVWLKQECGNATFEFYDAKLVNGVEGRLVPSGCQFVVTQECFSYEIRFHSELKKGEGKDYRLLLRFTPQPMTWKLTEAVWMSDLSSTISSHEINVSHLWDTVYETRSPLIMKPTEWYEPTLVITKYKITLFSKGPPSRNLTSTLSSSEVTPASEVAPYPYRWKFTERPDEELPPPKKPSVVFRVQSNDTKEVPGRCTFLTLTIIMSMGMVLFLVNILLTGVQTLFLCQTNNRMDSMDTKFLKREGGD